MYDSPVSESFKILKEESSVADVRSIINAAFRVRAGSFRFHNPLIRLQGIELNEEVFVPSCQHPGMHRDFIVMDGWSVVAKPLTMSQEGLDDLAAFVNVR